VPFVFDRTALLVATFASALVLAAGCKPPPAPEADKPAETKEEPAEAEAPKATGPVAKVNGEVIPRAAFDRQMDRTRARFERAGRQIAPALESRLKENLIRKLVDDTLIAQRAKTESVTVDAAELEEKFTEHRGRFGSDKAFDAFLERTSQSAEDVKSDLKRNLLRDKLFAKLMSGDQPTEADAETYYADNKNKYMQREQVRASHILFKVAKNDPSASRDEKMKKAKEVLALAKKKGSDFAALAKEHSEGPTASRGGDLGAFSRGRMVKEFEDAAFTAKANQVVGPVETKFGFHIIKVFDKTPERQRAYDEVKDSILTSLQARAKSKATREILKEMKGSAKIEILEPGVSLDRNARARPPVGPGGQAIPGAGPKARVPLPQTPGDRRPANAANPEAAARAKAAINKARLDAVKAKANLPQVKPEGSGD
jgi:peptidyl-prolyl cis-trans isomerase C